MRTDDFLADLGAQLRDTRPRRDPRPIAAVAILVIAVLLALALVPRDRERPTPAVPDGAARLLVINASGVPGAERRVAAKLEKRGFRVVETQPRFGRPSAITRFESIGRDTQAARRAAGVLGVERATVTQTYGSGYPADAVVYVGRDLAAVPRVSIDDRSGGRAFGERIAGRLRGAGYEIVRLTRSRSRFTTYIQAIGTDDEPARDVQRTLGLIEPPIGLADIHDGTDHGNVQLVLGRDLRSARALAARLPGTASCTLDEEMAPFYRCTINKRPYSVRYHADGCFAAKPLFTSRRELGGCP